MPVRFIELLVRILNLVYIKTWR